MNTTCDLNVDWTTCANCARLKARVDNADAAARTASERVDQTYDEYRAERDAGRAVIYTSQWLAWRDRIGNLEQALDEAHATWTAAIDEWAASINEHHRLHEERRQADTTQDRTETEEMSEVPEPEQSAPTCSQTIRITAYNTRLGDCHDVDPTTLPDVFIGYLANAASAAHHNMGMEARWQDAAGETEEMPTIQPDDDDMPCMIDTHTPCTCAMCQVLDALDDSGCDNLTVRMTVVPAHGLRSEYEEEGEQ